MKILRHRNLLGCLFAVLLSLPLLSILARTCYVAINKNAKDSYSDYYTDVALNVDSSNQSSLYTDGQRVSFSNTRERPTQWNSGNYGFRDISLDLNSLLNTNGKNYIYFNLYKDNYNIRFVADDSSFGYLNDYQNTFTFVVDTSNGNEVGLFNYGVVNIFTFTNGTLDNAFEYSINKITEGNNIGEVKFFTWFADLFLDLDNPSNALYINFINWYFNYAILVSAVYILFLVLMWFINFIRKLLERGMDFGQRGY